MKKMLVTVMFAGLIGAVSLAGTISVSTVAPTGVIAGGVTAPNFTRVFANGARPSDGNEGRGNEIVPSTNSSPTFYPGSTLDTLVLRKHSEVQNFTGTTANLTLYVFEGTKEMWDAGDGQGDGNLWDGTGISTIHTETFALNQAFSANDYVTLALNTPIALNNNMGFFVKMDQGDAALNNFQISQRNNSQSAIYGEQYQAKNTSQVSVISPLEYYATGTVPEEVFYADFGNGENLTPPANLPVTLNGAGLLAGSWSNFTTGTVGTKTQWGVEANSAGTDSALLLDVGNGMSLQGNLAAITDLTSEKLTFNWDWYATRTGAAKRHTIDFYDDDGNLVYGIQWIPDGNTNFNRIEDTTTGGSDYTPVLYLGADGLVGSSDVGSGLYDPSQLVSMTLEFLGDGVTINGVASGQALSYSEIAYFKLGLNSNGGALYDNFAAFRTEIPEPTSLLLLGLSGLMFIKRRRG